MVDSRGMLGYFYTFIFIYLLLQMAAQVLERRDIVLGYINMVENVKLTNREGIRYKRQYSKLQRKNILIFLNIKYFSY